MDPRHRTADSEDRWYRTVYDVHATPLLDYFLRRVSRDHAHDLVAEVFLIAWRRRATAPDEPNLRPWLFTVASNVLRNHQRGAARRMRLQERLRAHARTELAHQSPPDQSDTDALMLWALTQLREPDREILRLTAWEGCTADELATVLGCSANAAAVRLHRARRRLRKVLADMPPDSAANDTLTVPTARWSRRRP